MNTLLAPLFRRIESAGKMLNVPEWIIENELKRFKWGEITADKIRVPMDDGSYECFSATVALHCNPYPSNKYPYSGGIRLSHMVSPALLRALAVGMTFKYAVVDVEFAGGKAGVLLKKPVFHYSKQEIFRLIEETATVFIRDIPVISPRFYKPATDFGSEPEHMDAIHNKFWEITRGHIEGAPVTGCSEDYGGIPGRVAATGIGGLVVLDQSLKKIRQLNSTFKLFISDQPSLIVQGLGKVGGHFVRLAVQQGYRITGVSNVTGGVFNPNGIAVDQLPAAANASLAEIDGVLCTNEELLRKPCAVLVLAALENQITEENVEGIHDDVAIIVELANHPITEPASTRLLKRGKLIIPDLLASAGGGVASFWEWSAALGRPPHKTDMPRTAKEMKKMIKKVMEAATEEVWDYADVYQVPLRDAAWLKGMDRLRKALLRKHGGRWAPKGSYRLSPTP